MEFRGLRLDVLFSVASWQDLPWFFPVSPLPAGGKARQLGFDF